MLRRSRSAAVALGNEDRGQNCWVIFFLPKCDCATQFEGHVISHAGSVAWGKPGPRGTSESAPFTAPVDSAGRILPDGRGWFSRWLVVAALQFFFFLLPIPFFPVFPFFKIYGTAPREKLFTRSRIYFVDLINLKCGMCVYWLLSI